MVKLVRLGWIILCAVILAAACIFIFMRPSLQEPHEQQEVLVDLDWNVQLHPENAWVVYWDIAAAKEITSLSHTLKSVSLFSCFFDGQDDLFIPEQFENLKKIVREAYDGPLYLTFVNDIVYQDGTTSEKNTALLDRLLSSEDEMSYRADEFLKTAKDLDCQGIEMDFEKIRDVTQWRQYARMIELLWEKSQEKEMPMRVILPVNTPVKEFNLPAGPDYVVMCYNLYGNHSGPGPKADNNFLTGVAEKFLDIPNIGFALANGGFDWSSNGHVNRSLKTVDARKLALEVKATEKRDNNSGALEFRYKKESSSDYNTVWYADAVTLAYWRSILEEKMGHEVKVSMWRMESK